MFVRKKDFLTLQKMATDNYNGLYGLVRELRKDHDALHERVVDVQKDCKSTTNAHNYLCGVVQELNDEVKAKPPAKPKKPPATPTTT